MASVKFFLNSITLILVFLSLFFDLLYAQSQDENSKPEAKIEEVVRTEKDLKKIGINAVKTAQEAAKPLPNQVLSPVDVARNKAYHLRTLELFKMRTHYLEKIKNGELVPNAFLLEKVPGFKENLPTLTRLYNETLKSETERVKERNTSDILTMIQPLGLILAMAEHESNPATLSEGQVAEAAEWQVNFRKAMSEKDENLAPLIFLKGQSTYTLLHLKTPLLLRGKPNSKIYLETVDGGSFSNGVNRIELSADAEGFASTYWISGGESIGESMITAYSAGSPELIYHAMEVKQLKLKNLNPLTQVNNLIPSSTPNSEPGIPNPSAP